MRSLAGQLRGHSADVVQGVARLDVAHQIGVSVLLVDVANEGGSA